MIESDEDERSYVMVSGQDDEDDLETGGSHQKLKRRASSEAGGGSSAKNDLGLLHPQELLFCSLWYVFSGRISVHIRSPVLFMKFSTARSSELNSIKYECLKVHKMSVNE